VGMKESRKGVLMDERVLYTQKRPAHPGGGRGVYGHLPYELPFDYHTWRAAIKAAKEAGEMVVEEVDLEVEKKSENNA